MKKKIVAVLLAACLALAPSLSSADELMDITRAAGYTEATEAYRPKSTLLIDENGHHHNREEVIANHQPLLNNFDSFKMTSVSQKTKLISYELGGNFHTSIWRRNETWFMIYHQVTRIKDEK